MKKDIINQLQKAYVAIKNADSVNEIRVKPNPWLRNQLITIEQLLKRLLEDEDEI